MQRALVVIDVQESFRQRADWAAVSDPDIAAKVDRLVRHARATGDLVVWVLHTEPGSGTVFDPAAGFVRYIDGLEPEDGEIELTKTSHNAFTTTSLHQILTRRGIREVLVSGIRTEQCCETTTRHASDLGYSVSYAMDATLTFPMVSGSGRRFTAQEIRDRTELVLQDRFAQVQRSDAVLI